MSNYTNFSLKKDLGALFSKFYPQVDLKIIFVNDNSVSKMFRYKDVVPVNVQSNVVYKYTCPRCFEAYVGESSRHFKTRICEHKGVSPRTGLPIKKPKSNIYAHYELTGHEIAESSFEILYSNSNCNLKLIESIFIHNLSPSLNGMQYSPPPPLRIL